MKKLVSLVGTTGQPWTEYEIESTVAAYLEMLRLESRAEPYHKADFVRELGSLIPARSRRAIEAKFQNISAVREEAGLPWIAGYKPLPHYQRALKDAVLKAHLRKAESSTPKVAESSM